MGKKEEKLRNRKRKINKMLAHFGLPPKYNVKEKEIRGDKIMKKILMLISLIAISLMFLVSCSERPEVTVEGSGTFIIDAGGGVTMEIDSFPVVDSMNIDGQSYIEHQEGEVTIIRD